MAAAAAALPCVHWLLLPLAAAVEDDVLCLEGVKSSLASPNGSLASWTFANTSASHICNLEGVACWNLNENRIISIQLTGFGLSGGLPESLKNCHSLQTLDLSQNKLDGPIPPQICLWFPYLVKLDLSSNSLSSPIPSQIADCKFLNNLILSDNKLSGPIPYGVGRLDRLKQFSVQGNRLSGSIPSVLSKFSSSRSSPPPANPKTRPDPTRTDPDFRFGFYAFWAGPGQREHVPLVIWVGSGIIESRPDPTH